MMRLRLFLATYMHMLQHAFNAAFASPLRALATGVIIATCALIIFNLDDSQNTQAEGDLARALDVSRFFKERSDTLEQDLTQERLRRRIAEQTVTALSENIREQDEAILDNQQQLAFYRQLLEERGRSDVQTVIRSFEIFPEFRDNYYQLSAVLVRGTGIDEPFAGKLGLTLFLRDQNGASYDLTPIFEPAALDVSFRYYHEVQAVFSVPDGSDILNGQLALHDDNGSVVASKILTDIAP